MLRWKAAPSVSIAGATIVTCGIAREKRCAELQLRTELQEWGHVPELRPEGKIGDENLGYA